MTRAASRRFSLLVDRKSTRLNSSHSSISYAVFCLKKKILGVDGWLFGNDAPTSIIGEFERFIGIHIHDARFAHDQGTERLIGKAGLRAGAGGPQRHDCAIVKEDEVFFLMFRLPPRSTLFPYTTLFR